jgi:hypothetical protein
MRWRFIGGSCSGPLDAFPGRAEVELSGMNHEINEGHGLRRRDSHWRLRMASHGSHSAPMNHTLQARITTILGHAPEWIRQKLSSKEKATRARAEEALAAMIASALKDADEA